VTSQSPTATILLGADLLELEADVGIEVLDTINDEQEEPQDKLKRNSQPTFTLGEQLMEFLT
jgi:hypothetical protein